MGFFDFLNKNSAKTERLLKWQNVVMPDSGDKLIATEKQLKAFSAQQAENDLRIINDCKNLIDSTVNPETFFTRLNLLIEKTKHLCALEPYISFSGASPTEAYNQVVENYQGSIKQFLIRYFSDTFDKAEAMKTEKGRIGKYQRFYDTLQEYYCYMNGENKDYIETKYRAYARTTKRG